MDPKEKNMSPCCGRPNNRNKQGGEAGYYARFAYLSSHQKARQAQLSGSKCEACAALTVGDPCSVCGKAKNEEQKEGAE